MWKTETYFLRICLRGAGKSKFSGKGMRDVRQEGSQTGDWRRYIGSDGAQHRQKLAQRHSVAGCKVDYIRSFVCICFLYFSFYSSHQ